MKHTTLIAAGAALLMAGGSAIAACPQDIDSMRTQLQGDQGFRDRYTRGQVDTFAYRRLFEAAQVFSRNDMDQHCQEVLAGIRELSQRTDSRAGGAMEDRTERRAGERPPADRGTGVAPTPRPPAMAGRDLERDRVAMLRGARPIEQVAVSADDLIDADVRNRTDEDLGDVVDVILDRGRVTHLIISHDEFLGMGGSYRMVEAKHVHVVPDLTVANWRTTRTLADRPVVVLEMSEARVETMPVVELERGVWRRASGEPVRGGPPDSAPGAAPERDQQRDATPPRDE